MSPTNQRPGQVHKHVAQEAGLSSISFVSVLAGLITAYGTFAVVAAVVGASLSAADVDTEFRTNDWTGSGAAAGLATAVTLQSGAVNGRTMTSWPSLRTDLENAGATWVDQDVVIDADGGTDTLLSSRKPADLPAFSEALGALLDPAG